MFKQSNFGGDVTIYNLEDVPLAIDFIEFKDEIDQKEQRLKHDIKLGPNEEIHFEFGEGKGVRVAVRTFKGKVHTLKLSRNEHEKYREFKV